MSINSNNNNILNANERIATNLTLTGQNEVQFSTFDRSHSIKVDFDSGKLIPFFADEALPADTYNIKTTILCRSTTPLFQTMDSTKITTAYFFIPNRLVWNKWKEFMGENQTKWIQENYDSLPFLDFTGVPEFKYKPNDLGSLMGVPANVDLTKIGMNINPMAFRALVKVWNDWFRDQNFQDDLNNDNQGNPDSVAIPVKDYDWNNIEASAQIGVGQLPVNNFPDYFQTLLPAPQKSQNSFLPLNFNIVADGDFALKNPYQDSRDLYGPGPSGNQLITNGSYPQAGLLSYSSGLTTDFNPYSINDLRENIAIQHYFETDARGGTRYIEWLANHFGVDISNAELQRSDLMGGSSDYLEIKQILQTVGVSASSPLGEVGGQGETAIYDKSNINYSVKEHGFVIGVLCVRPVMSYSQGLPQMFTRQNKFDFYSPSFANLGEQPIFKSEIFLSDKDNGATNKQVLGYNEAWANERYKHNRLIGNFQKNVAGYEGWNYGIKYAEAPTLSDKFRETDKNLVGQTLVFPEESQYFADIYVKLLHTRALPMQSIPGLDKI